MARSRCLNLFIYVTLLSLVTALTTVAGDKIIKGEKFQREITPGDNRVHYPCLTPLASERIHLPLEREQPWSLPKTALAANFLDTINILVLRYNFQYEDPDDPNTTGRGWMNLSSDTVAFKDSSGHFIDPPPHDSLYFDAHLRALRTYYEIVSDGKITLAWDIFPPAKDSIYELPKPMNYYGKCESDSLVVGLERYFVDCIRLADTVSPEIIFSQYESIFLFHAGSDRQNDIGFPETCNDLFTGYISFSGDTVIVDNGTDTVRTALMLPETSSQDNRATALNAVIAHEFGHQLGLVDLYSTRTFMSMLGDFALMDNNGFGTGIDFGFDVGRVFGAIPLFPSAWSRAHLGFIEVADYRQGSNIRLVAAEIVSDGIKIARVPITEKEYYLIENRVIDIDGSQAAARVDSVTNVILGPTDLNKVFNREYDFLLPGSGVLIYHVDERVAGLDYDYDGVSNFDDNDLQWSHDIYGNPVNRFITLVEADGFVNFGGFYRSGWGKEEDMFRDDRNNSFTPNTNPPAIDNTGNNTHIFITNIGRALDTTVVKEVLMDSVILFDVETDRLAPGFPVRGGQPLYGLSPIVDDLDGDGNDEIIFASGNLLSVVTPDGNNFLHQFTQCSPCQTYEDTAVASVHAGRAHPVPLYVKLREVITAGPVSGMFPDNPDANKLVVVGFNQLGGFSNVELYRLRDNFPNDGQADIAGSSGQGFFVGKGIPIAMSFEDILYVLTDSGYVYRKDSFLTAPYVISQVNATEFHGICRINDGLIVMAGDALFTKLFYINNGDTTSIALNDYYTLGPVLVDMNLDNIPEVLACTRTGDIILVSVDTSLTGTSFSIMNQKATSALFTVNPVAGDVDLDGYPDIVIAGTNAVYAYNHELTLKTSFPIEINDRFPNDDVIAPPVIADIERGGMPEIIFPTQVGNIYSYGLDISYGFPLSAGEIGVGSSVILNDTTGGKLGYLGADGWFYLWEIDTDTITNFWPMGGADPGGSFSLNNSKLPSIKQYTNFFPEEQFYNYPNPVVNGNTTIRYFLGKDALQVTLRIYDLSGQEIADFSGPTTGGVDNEITWNCSDVSPGIYRCMINVDFNGNIETSFTDIAVIR